MLQVRLRVLCVVSERGGEAGVVCRVPATGCARADIMWLLDEPNQPYEGNHTTATLITPVALTLILTPA